MDIYAQTEVMCVGGPAHHRVKLNFRRKTNAPDWAPRASVYDAQICVSAVIVIIRSGNAEITVVQV